MRPLWAATACRPYSKKGASESSSAATFSRAVRCPFACRAARRAAKPPPEPLSPEKAEERAETIEYLKTL